MKKTLFPLSALVPLLGALGLMALSIWFRLANLDPLPEAERASLYPAENAVAVSLYSKALRFDDANPYRWADYGEALANAGEFDKARLALNRAVVLAPHVPSVRLRLLNFLLLRNEKAEILTQAAEVLHAVPDYDQLLFGYLRQAIGDRERILAALSAGGKVVSSRAIGSWLLYSTVHDDPAAARLAWESLVSQQAVTLEQASAYAEFLLRHHEWAGASQAWAAFAGRNRGDYPSGNLIFNASFAAEPRKSPFDWHIALESEDFQVTREAPALGIHFQGQTNVNAEPAWQTVVLPRAGTYRLSASVRTERLTTNEGLRLAIPDLGLTSESVSGSVEDAPLELRFSVAVARTVRVALVRRPSEKFDNKIEGSVWVRNLKLVAQDKSVRADLAQ